jgi:Sigma-70, region 4
MATLESLPPDQRAVLQLVLMRGRGYDEIARLLSMNRASVRDRALRAFDALGPQTGVGEQRRALITDYLLGQLPSAVAAEVREHLAETPAERAWARVLASELAPFSKRVSLPDIPSEGATRGAEDVASVPDAAEVKKERQSIFRRRRSKEPDRPAPPMLATIVPDVPDRPPRSSRLGGAILIALAVIAVAVVVAVLLSSGGSNPKHPAVASTPTTSTSSTAGASGTTSSGAKVVAQINLTAAKSGSKAAGIAEVLKEGANNGIAIVAQNVPPNTTKPPNAYAVWLYNSTKDAHILGFVNPGVGSNGRLSTAGGLPANASHYKQLVVTVETTAHPATPGLIILQGALTGI